MLYVTTRIHGDAFTARHALTENRGPAGGFYLPMRLPELGPEHIASLGEKSFGQNVADVLNILFNGKLDGWTVDISIGKHPVKTAALGNKVYAAELWHNPKGQLEWLARNLAEALLDTQVVSEISEWMMVSTRISLLFGIYGDLVRSEVFKSGDRLDVAVPAADLSQATAAFFARKLGLPIGNIVVSCNENNGLWNLLHQGELRTQAAVVKTGLPKCDYSVPPGLERLIFSILGAAQTDRFLQKCVAGGNYSLSEFQMKQLRKGFYVSVVSQHRTEAMVSGICGSCGYIPDPYVTQAYCGLMDYRAGAGEHGIALILGEDSPLCSPEFISEALGISQEELKERIEGS